MKSILKSTFGILILSIFLTIQISSASKVNIDEPDNVKLLIIPFNSLGIDEVSITTAQNLFKFDLYKYCSWEVEESDQTCAKEKCAVELGKEANAQKSFLCNMSMLGEKIIIQFILIDVASSKKILSETTSALSIEDLENVMNRIALSVAREEPLNQTAEVGTITEKEQLPELRRGAERMAGFSFGYLFPQQGYDDFDKSFTFDFRAGFEMEQTAIGMLLAIRKGFAANIYGDYLFSKNDICPYLGGAFGFHWVSHNNISQIVYNVSDNGYYNSRNKQSDGFELTINTGLRLFRTYDFQLLLNLDYIFTFNDYNDRGLVFTIGILR